MTAAQATTVDTWQDVFCPCCRKKIGRIRFGISEFKCKHCGKLTVIQRENPNSMTVTIDTGGNTALR